MSLGEAFRTAMLFPGAVVLRPVSRTLSSARDSLSSGESWRAIIVAKIDIARCLVVVI